jgi:transglutaminase-like putative cysteine protease
MHKARQKTRFFSAAVFVVIFLFSGCAHRVDSRYPFDFEKHHDLRLPADVAYWLKGGEQSVITPRIEAEAKKIYGKNRRERLFRAMRHVWEYFSYDRWLNTLKFTRTADELYENRVLGGCSDFALAEIVMFRALGIPSRMVVTANVDWIYQYRQDDLAMAEGHSFIEVFLEDRWYLVDSTYRWLFSDYVPGRPSYPHGEYFCRRGKDFWDMGLKDGGDLERELGERALSYPGDFKDPGYPKYPI